MRILLHDHGSFSFPIQLSRRLADHGHEIVHTYTETYAMRGRLWQAPDDPPNLTIAGLTVSGERDQNNFLLRLRQEREYGALVVKHMREFQPDVVLCTNTPIETCHRVFAECQRVGTPYIHWAQDLNTLAIERILNARVLGLGTLASLRYVALERQLFEGAAASIVISPDFLEGCRKLGIRPRNPEVIGNWMPIDEMTPGPKDNPWARKHGIEHTFNIMYTGTVGFKHDVTNFLALAEGLRKYPDVRIVVVGGGTRWERLQEIKQQRQIDNLLLFGWQNYQDFPQVLSAGDVLMAAISPEASDYSVPCKVLTYLSAGRPILAAIPESNLVARILLKEGLGLVSHPSDVAAQIKQAVSLIEDPGLRTSMGRRARSYAEHVFDIDRISQRFENIFSRLGFKSPSTIAAVHAKQPLVAAARGA